MHQLTFSWLFQKIQTFFRVISYKLRLFTPCSCYGAEEMTSKSQVWACSFPDTIGYRTIRIRCLWTRKFSYLQKNICWKKNFPIRVDMDENCFRARSSTITSLTMVSPFLSRRIVLLSRLKMCILIGFSTGPSLSVPQWNSLNESLFQVLRRVLRFNFRVQLPFFLELIINWHWCCLNCFSETDCFHNNRSSVDFRQSKN